MHEQWCGTCVSSIGSLFQAQGAATALCRRTCDLYVAQWWPDWRSSRYVSSKGQQVTEVPWRMAELYLVNTAWTRSSTGLATSAVPEEAASCGRLDLSSGQVVRRRAWLAAMVQVLSLGFPQGRRYSNAVATTLAHTQVTSCPSCRCRGQSWCKWKMHIRDNSEPVRSCWRIDTPLHSSLATPVYLYVCVKHVNSELRDINVSMLYSI